ncbi:MAG: hypothetical protein PHD76_15200, partial [Methylacidiphilales bacterium]|nr:hypothetical protein [Candidatus Methylacidiphilales bacterium]
FDQPRSLGGTETGAQAALPMWMGYMGRALKSVPEGETTVPEGVISVKINPQNGLRVAEGGEGIPEYFYLESAPQEQRGAGEGFFGGGGRSSEEVKDQLF